jgi:hypothetical protein
MPERPRIRLNAVQRRARKAAQITKFVSAVGRKSSDRNGMDPNDRHFDPDFSKRLQRMPLKISIACSVRMKTDAWRPKGEKLAGAERQDTSPSLTPALLSV